MAFAPLVLAGSALDPTSCGQVLICPVPPAVLDAMAESLEKMGIGLVQFHAESGPGQFEVGTQHARPLEAADQLLLTREAVTQVAGRSGLRASLHPKPHAEGAGSGCHCHISLRQMVGMRCISCSIPLAAMSLTPL